MGVCLEKEKIEPVKDYITKMTFRECEGWNYIMNETLRASRVVMIISVQSVISVNLPRLRHSFFLLRARDLDFDEAVGPGLRRIDLGVLAGVLDALVPRQVYMDC